MSSPIVIPPFVPDIINDFFQCIYQKIPKVELINEQGDRIYSIARKHIHILVDSEGACRIGIAQIIDNNEHYYTKDAIIKLTRSSIKSRFFNVIWVDISCDINTYTLDKIIPQSFVIEKIDKNNMKNNGNYKIRFWRWINKEERCPFIRQNI